MTFIGYLNSKRMFIIIWLSIHGLALFVNFFNIEGGLDDNHKTYSEQRNDGMYSGNYDVKVEKYINILTTEPSHFYGEEKNTSYFWPIVKFTEKKTYLHRVDYNRFNEVTMYSFNGIFYRYDISEFLAYNILLLLVFYFRWSYKRTKNNVT